MTESFVFNGINGQTGNYLNDATDLSQVARLALGTRLSEDEADDILSRAIGSFPVKAGLDANDLGQTGWAIVFPAVEPNTPQAREQDAIREALQPLLDLRRAMATTAREHRYRVCAGADGYRPRESKHAFLSRMGAGASGPVDPDNFPYYVLIVGSPEKIPYHVQYQLDVQYGVGRIDFDTLDQYAMYADSVVAAETRPRARALEAAFFAVENPGDKATYASTHLLAAPLADALASRFGDAWRVDRFFSDAATKQQLEALLCDRAPALLFTASHGLGYPATNPSQRKRQGALVCQDWPGPRTQVSQSHYFAGDDITERADLTGLIAFHFACYGVGTPSRDEFWCAKRVRKAPDKIAEQPFVADLPKRMLGRNNGALACIGHVDRAWAASFLQYAADGKAGVTANLTAFESTLHHLMSGARVGHAMDPLDLRYAELTSDLTTRIDNFQTYDEPIDERALAMDWLYANDARNYAVVGDPAVRIAVH